MPRVSIIIPTYNRAILLKYALDSVLAQTFQDFEVIVIDDESTDNTSQLVEGCSPKVRYLRLKHCGLPARLRNGGLQIAQGEYVAFLDSDDQWLPQKLQQQVAVLDKHPKVGLVCSNALILKEGQDKPDRLYLRDSQGKSGRVLNELLKDNFVIISSAVVRRSLLDCVGIFAEDLLLRGIDDYDLWLRIAAVSEFYYIPEALVIYRDHAGSMRLEKSRVSYWQGMLLILEHIRQYLKDWGYQDTLIEQLMDDLAYTYHCQLINAHWAATQHLEAAKCILQLVRQRPMNLLKLIFRVLRKGLQLRP